MSQCGVSIEGDTDKLYIEDMGLLNAHLITNPNIKVNKISIISSEKITTGLPVPVDEAKITITSSKDMIEAQKLIKGVNIIPGSGEFVYDTKIIYHNSKPINVNNDAKIADAVYNIQQLKSSIKNLKWAAPVVSWFVVGEKLDKHNLDVSKIRILPSVESRDEKSEEWYVSKYNRKNAYLVSKDLDNRPNYGGVINDASLLRYS